jgi:hypothetical protein
LALAGGDFAAVRARCDAAPEPDACAYGLGKQVFGATGDAERTAAVCRAGDARRAAACRAGVVATTTDQRWRADEAVAFCRTLPAGEKPDCYASVGRATAPMQPTPALADAECAKAEPAYIRACASGARAPDAGRGRGLSVSGA